jgi:uncharacterized RDD family membrane protein YckC
VTSRPPIGGYRLRYTACTKCHTLKQFRQICLAEKSELTRLALLNPPAPFAFLLTDALPPDRRIGTLWRRLAAFLVDTLLVGVAGNFLALPFFNAFSSLGAWARVVGFLLALPYYSIFNSAAGNGQTIGKRLLHLQVVDIRGNPISFLKSLIRYAVFAIPYFLNSLPLPVSRTPRVVFTLVEIIFFGAFTITLYLIFFNRHTRQGLHDLAAGSYVADADSFGPLKVLPIWKPHWGILALLLGSIAVTQQLLEKKADNSPYFSQLLQDARTVENLKDVQGAGVQDMHWKVGTADEKTIFIVNVRWQGKSVDQEALADQVASALLKSDSKVRERDLLRVNVIRGYDLGIASARIQRSFEHSPSEWTARLQPTPPPSSATPTSP